MPSFSRSSLVLRLLLTLPAVFLLAALANGETWRFAIRPSGDFAAKLLVVTLSISPLRVLFPQSRWTAWLMSRRRILGLSAFFYALFHLAVFCASIGRLDWIVQGMAFASMWTGWTAFALLAAVASISHAAATAHLGLWWKRIQRLAYPAALLTLAHWLLLSRSEWEALAHAVPVAVLWGGVAAKRLFSVASAANNRTR